MLTRRYHVEGAWFGLPADAVGGVARQCAVVVRALRSILGHRDGGVGGELRPLARRAGGARAQLPMEGETFGGLRFHLAADAHLLVARHAVLMLLALLAHGRN